MATRKKPAAPPSASRASAGETAIGSYKPVDALKHDKGLEPVARPFIPSSEEKGQEAEAIAGLPTRKEVPLNPVTRRGQDPELYWMHKYGEDDAQQQLDVDIRSLYRHEHIAPEKIIASLYKLRGRDDAQNELFTHELFGNPLAMDELDKPLSYYKQPNKWQNRLIQGDSLLVMSSLLEREGMAGQVQCIYIDPPYGIKYGSNWQMRLNDRNMPNGDSDDALSGEAEVIKAFRDTWELGIHSYLSYLRDRLLAARELLSLSGSCFVQISDQNMHLVRSVMDEVFGSENYLGLLSFKKKGSQSGDFVPPINEYLIWYARSKADAKFRAIYVPRDVLSGYEAGFTTVQLADGSTRPLSKAEVNGTAALPPGARIFRANPMFSDKGGPNEPVEINGKSYPSGGNSWKVSPRQIPKLHVDGRVIVQKTRLRFKSFADDFPLTAMSNLWLGLGGATDKQYVVQTNVEVVKRCILMTTDPGDLVFDPTCGSGTTAYVAEQWGRRWISTDTSRIALNIAKTRLMTATYPWYKLMDVAGQDVRHGFKYKRVTRITLGSLANDELPEVVELVDKPEEDNNKLRVAGPFTVETLQADEPIAPDQMAATEHDADSTQRFIDRIFQHLKTAGVKNGAKRETAVFTRVDIINDPEGALHAEGWYGTATGERKAYFHIGPQFGTVSRVAVNDAVKACARRGDADWLLALGFGFESDIENRSVTRRVGSFEVTKVRMHDDLMQEGLIKKDKKAASFVTIGEPDIGLIREGGIVQVEIRGLDIYDPIRDEVKPRSASDISYWMLDADYDGSNFVPSQVFFCGGDKDEFDKFKRGLSGLAAASVKRNAERMLKIEMDDEAFERVYGFRSHPLPEQKGKKIAVRVISQFGEESTKVLTL
ncbi:site-specific DNA-methyltransferase [Ramlibacter sp. WS9]|uniref:site-specific DNA-methyltransferase n=1 Tax=Ramlibacter sp. WS9 TaxID=1882741 RepID=UPI0011424266|nr:site-specific DNA-methyltransferase [Ramlibacter sp. WS9]ROZ79084.1 site-specific DNA-methyltransferase [Ramlibacter sp. WS9]